MNDAQLAGLSEPDRERLAEVEALAARPDAVHELVARLGDPSWPVRRAVVGALGRLGDPAVGPLVDALVADRTDERRIAATVDALVASAGSPEGALIGLDGADPAVICDAAQILGRRRSRAGVDALVAWTAHPDDNVCVAAMEALGRVGSGAGLDALAAAAASGNFFRTFGAIEVLARYEEPGALAPLVAALRDPVAGVEATRALGRRGLPDAVPALAALLDAKPGSRARAAASALVAIAARQVERFGTAGSVTREVRSVVRDPGATSRMLARAVPEGEPDERAAIAQVLGWLGDPSGASPIISMLSDEPRVARAASTALAELGGDATRELLNAVAEGDTETRLVLLPAVPVTPTVSVSVSACLEDPDPEVRRMACELLARAQAVDAVPALFRTLDDDDPRVGQAAAAAIQALGHDRTEALSLKAARSPSRRVRRAGLRLLGYFGWPSGVDTLVEAVETEDDRLVETALHSLAFVEHPRALEALLASATAERAPRRAAALRALGHTSATPDVVARLSAGLSDPDPWARYYACQSIGRLQIPGFVETLVGLLRDPAGHVRIAVIDALARSREPVAVRALLDAVKDRDADVRRAALLGLGTVRPPEGLAPVLAMATASDATTRVIALSALGGFQGPEVEPTLAAAAQDPDESVRSTAVGVLGGRPGITATSALIGLLGSSVHDAVLGALATWVPGRVPALLFALEGAEPHVASWVVSALARIDHPEARAALTMALVMDRPATRRAAASALAAIGAGTARLQLEIAADTDTDAEVRRLARQALAQP